MAQPIEQPGTMTKEAQNRLRNLTTNQALSLMGILLLLWLILSRLSPYFFTLDNVLQITLQAAVMSLIAAGETFVILSGGIDLSVGSTFAFSAMVMGMSMQAHSPLGLSVGLGLLAGAGCGMLNGLGVSLLKLPPFIVTLGMMSVLRGFALLINNGTPIFGLTSGFEVLGQGRIAGVIPVPTLVVLTVYVICWFILRQNSVWALYLCHWQ